MAFEVFKETGTRTREFISITETKTFGVPRAFLDKHGITAQHKAVILYDTDENKVALHFSTKDTKIAFAVRITGEKQGAIIAARSFFDVKGIDVKKYAGRYEFEKKSLSELGVNSPGEAFVITLKEKPIDDPALISSEEVSAIDDAVSNEDKPAMTDLFGED